jgi:hypothetical protein
MTSLTIEMIFMFREERVHKGELHTLHVSPNIGVRKSRRMRWTGHVARMGYEKCVQNLWENVKEGDHSEYIDVDGRMIV